MSQSESRTWATSGQPLMSEFLQQVVAGLGSGAVYGALALALVLIHRATGVINFAQGEMAMFTTYIAWALMEHHGWSYWPAFIVTLVFAFVLGFGIQRVVIAPVAKASVLTIVIMTIGLVLTFNGLAPLIWSAEVRAFPSAFPNETWQIGDVSISQEDIGTFAIVAALVTLLWAFFQFTKIGLALRASAINPEASRLVGVRVGWMLAVGWGLAAVLGAVAGMLAAPSLFLDPNMMQGTLIFAFAAAILGGIDSPFGAVAGGLLLGVGLNLIGAYVDFVGAELRLPVALLIILIVLLVRPAGIFGKPVTRRV
jgi:branched-chain amino acid transport system permease protein